MSCTKSPTGEHEWSDQHERFVAGFGRKSICKHCGVGMNKQRIHRPDSAEVREQKAKKTLPKSDSTVKVVLTRHERVRIKSRKALNNPI